MDLKKRALLARVVVALVVAWSFTPMTVIAADVQSSKRLPTIGILGTTPPTTPQGARIWDAFKRGLREAGWIEGKNVLIEWRWVDGRPEHFSELAAELTRLDVDVIVTGGSQAAKAVKGATGTIPIVFTAVADPVGAGFVASLARPGGNMTGVSNQFGDLTGKWLQLAKEMVPRLSRVGIMWNPDDPGSALSFKDSNETYARLGVKVTSVPVKASNDFEGGFELLSRERPEFLIVHPSPVIFRNRQRVSDFAVRHRLPTSSGTRTMVVDGSILMSYGPDYADLLHRTAGYVDRILKGARPDTLSVEQPTRFEVVVNRRAARAIGLELTPAFLARVDHLIE